MWPSSQDAVLGKTASDASPLLLGAAVKNHEVRLARIEDHGQPPDGSSVLLEMPDPALEGLEVSGAAEFSAALGR